MFRLSRLSIVGSSLLLLMLLAPPHLAHSPVAPAPGDDGAPATAVATPTFTPAAAEVEAAEKSTACTACAATDQGRAVTTTGTCYSYSDCDGGECCATTDECTCCCGGWCHTNRRLR